jgi:hypothetical protein
MGTFRMILYPFALACIALCFAMLLGMAMFGVDTVHWPEWQGELVGSIGTVAGLAGAIVGLWMAIRAEHRVMK